MVKKDDTNVGLTGDAEKMWNEIKNKPINLWALPAQLISQNVSVLPVSDTQLFITLKSPAVLPALEEALSGKYTVTQNDKYIIITRA